MNREAALSAAMAAGWLGDEAALVKLRVNSRVSWENLKRAYAAGRKQSEWAKS